MLKRLRSLFHKDDDDSYRDGAFMARVYAPPRPYDDDDEDTRRPERQESFTYPDDHMEEEEEDVENTIDQVFRDLEEREAKENEEVGMSYREEADMRVIYAPPEVMFGKKYREMLEEEYPQNHAEDDEDDDETEGERNIRDVYGCPRP